MKNNKIVYIVILVVIIVGVVSYMLYNANRVAAPLVQTPAPVTETPASGNESPNQNPDQNQNDTTDAAIVYKNSQYGFNYDLPADWKGYSIVQTTWQGNAIKTNTAKQSGPKLLIRNPKWTAKLPYEDIPVLVFTIKQWGSYEAEDFAVSAAPIAASEVDRNNKYVFAMPPRWDFDYSQGYTEAQNIVNSKPLHPFAL